jgi:hypothetical protein
VNIDTKIFNKILATHIKNMTHLKSDRMVQHIQINKYNRSINRIKDKNYFIISVDAEKD